MTSGTARPELAIAVVKDRHVRCDNAFACLTLDHAQDLADECAKWLCWHDLLAGTGLLPAA